jgi:hypothetical protein
MRETTWSKLPCASRHEGIVMTDSVDDIKRLGRAVAFVHQHDHKTRLKRTNFSPKFRFRLQ